MNEYDKKMTNTYEENLRKMHHVLTERCQRYMTKNNELENVIYNDLAMKELKA